MSETVPTPAVNTEQNENRPVEDAYMKEQARLEAEFEEKRQAHEADKAKLEQKQAFGQFDQFEGPLLEDGRPIAGSHADYHAQRPSEGIIRDGDSFRNTENGKFASEDAYEGQRESDTDYYDRVNQSSSEKINLDTADLRTMAVAVARAEVRNDRADAKEIKEAFKAYLDIAATREIKPISGDQYDNEVKLFNHIVERTKNGHEEDVPDYESMQVAALALATAKAERSGDTEEASFIRDFVQTRALEAVTHPESEMTEKDYDDEIQRFTKLVEHGKEILDRKEGVADLPETDATSESEQYSQEYTVAAEPMAVGAQTKVEAEAAGWSEDQENNEQTEQKAEHTVGDKVQLSNGAEAFLYAAEPREIDGATEYQVMLDGGLPAWIDQDEIEFLEKDVDTAPADEETEDAFKPDCRIMDADGELHDAKIVKGPYENKDGYAVVDLVFEDGSTATVEADELKPADYEKEQTKKEKLANFFKKSAKFIKERFTFAYVGAKMSEMKFRYNEWASSRKMHEGMSDDERNEQEKRNRRLALIAGGAALAVVAIGVGVGIHEAVQHAQENQDALNEAAKEHAKQVAAEKAAQAAEHAKDVAAEKAKEAAEALNATVNVDPREGGIQLFQNLGIDNATETWNAHSESLLQNFPSDFYRMDNGGIGLAHEGELSDAAARAINALK